MKNLEPTATARITPSRTKSGTIILTVAVFTPDGLEWRRYRHHDPDLDRIIAAALRSCGVPAAWAWGMLPLDLG